MRFNAISLLLCASLGVTAQAADPVGPFQWSGRSYDPANPQAWAVARDGTTESATALDGTNTAGRIRLKEWSGDNQAGGRGVGGVNVVLPAGNNGFLGLVRDWSIQEGTDAGLGSFVYYTKFQQDALAVLGFADADPSALALGHGAGFGIEGSLPYDRVMLVLPWRWVQGAGSAFQNGAYGGNPPTASFLYAVPANMSLSDCQKNPALYQLASVGNLFFKDFQPHQHGASFKIQLLGGGHWQVLADLDDDGVVDVVTDDQQLGNKLSPFSTMTERSGLILSTRAAMGSKAGTVGRTTWTLSYRLSPTVPEVVTDRRPFTANIPIIAKSSPVVLEGQAWNSTLAITATAQTLGPDPVPVARINGSSQWFLDLPLDPAASTRITFAQTGIPTPTIRSGNIWWEPLSLYHHDAITIRRGDSVKLQCSSTCGGQTVTIDADGDGVIDWTGIDADSMVRRYDQAGVFTARAYQNGLEVGSSVITVVDILLPRRIVAQKGFAVDVDVLASNGINSVQLTSKPSSAANVLPTTRSGNVFRFRITPNVLGPFQIETAVNGGPAVVSTPAVGFQLTSTSSTGGVVNDISSETRPLVRLVPFVPDLTIEFDMFAGAGSFSGYNKSFTLNTSAAVSSLGEPGFTVETDTVNGLIGSFRHAMYVSAANPSTCYKMLPYAEAMAGATSTQVQTNLSLTAAGATGAGSTGSGSSQIVGNGTAVNGSYARVKVELTTLKEFESKTLNVTVVKANSTGGSAQAGSSAGSTWDSPPPLTGSLSLGKAGPSSEITIDGSKFQVGPNAPDLKEPHFPGKYDVSIGDARWSDVIAVEESKKDPYTKPIGKLSLGGAVYNVNGYNFIPPAKISELTAIELEDEDIVDGKKKFDTFDKTGAVDVLLKKGSGTLSKSGKNSWSYLSPSDLKNGDETTLNLYLTDDGTYVKDKDGYISPDVRIYTYELKGVDVVDGTDDKPWPNSTPYFYNVRAKNMGGFGPDLEFSLEDEKGTALQVYTTRGPQRFKIDKPGRYFFRIKNPNRLVEDFKSSPLVIYQMSLEPTGNLECQWDSPALKNIPDFAAKAKTLLEKAQEMQKKAETGKNWSELGAASVTTLLEKMDTTIPKWDGKLPELNKAQKDAEVLETIAKSLHQSVESKLDEALDILADLIAKNADQATINAQLDVVLKLTEQEKITFKAWQQTIKDVDFAVANVKAAKGDIDVLKAARAAAKEASLTETTLESIGKKIEAVVNNKAIKYFGTSLEAVGIAFNGIALFKAHQEFVEYLVAYNKSEAERKALQDALDEACKESRMKAGDEKTKKTLTVKSIPGNVDFSLEYDAVEWKTKDEKFSDANKPILAMIDGSYDNWAKPYSTDSSGSKPFTLSFQGNIGSQLCRVRTKNDGAPYGAPHMQFRVKAAGSTQDEIIEAYKKEIMNANALIGMVKAAVDGAFELIQAALSVLAIFAAFGAGPLGALLILGIQVLVGLIKAWVVDGWFQGKMETNFEKQIKKEYPK